VSEHDRGAHPPQDPDVLPVLPLVAVFVGVTIVGVGLGAWACAVAPRGPGEHGELPDAPAAALEDSDLDASLFDGADPRAQTRAAERQALRTWGWVDRERGIVRMPIETAMQLELAAREADR